MLALIVAGSLPMPKFIILDDRAILAVGGPDRRQFLQGLVSNDVEKLAPDRALYAALLTAQGKYLHDFIMVDAGETIWLDCEAARLVDLKRRLSMYRLRAKVTVDEAAGLAVGALFGHDASAALGLPEEAGAARPREGGIVLIDPRLSALGARVVMERERLADLAGGRDAGAPLFTQAEFAEYDRLRLSLGVPDGSRDLVIDKSILLESGFDELHGVDWQKGCYVGQELTARTKYRGLIKKRLFPVKIDGPTPPPGTVLQAAGREAGEMRSSRDGVGLALLRLESVGQPLSAEAATLSPQKPDWMKVPE